MLVVSPSPHPHDGIVVGLPRGSTDRDLNEIEKDVRVAPADRGLMRTPEPTPSEQFLLTHKARECNWARILDWRRYRNPRVFWPLAVTVTLVLILILFIAFKHQLVDKMRPFADWMYRTPGGWLIPIALLIVMSFPPLFGHEIVAILCGVVWGIWLGFAIVAAGTALGELANFYVYKWWCGARGRKLEESKLNWALLAEVIRTGGLRMPLLMRLTYIPSHFLTAVFSTCGMNFWIFTASAVLSLPKQLAVVFIGVSGADGQDLPTATRAAKYSVIGATVLLTVVAMWYVYRRMDAVKGPVIYARRKRRQAKLLAAAGLTPAGRAYGSVSGLGERGGRGTSDELMAKAKAKAKTKTGTQVHVNEFELESRGLEDRGPRRPLPPALTRSESAGAVWHYPILSVDDGDEGSRSPLMPKLADSNAVDVVHEQHASTGGGMERHRSAASATSKPGFIVVGHARGERT